MSIRGLLSTLIDLLHKFGIGDRLGNKSYFGTNNIEVQFGHVTGMLGVWHKGKYYRILRPDFKRFNKK